MKCFKRPGLCFLVVYHCVVVVLAVNVSRGEKTAVVMGKDHKVKGLEPKTEVIDISDLKDMIHEVGGTDPNFIPPPAPIVAPQTPGTPTTAQATVINPMPAPQIIASQPAVGLVPKVEPVIEEPSKAPSPAPVAVKIVPVEEVPATLVLTPLAPTPQAAAPVVDSQCVVAMDLFSSGSQSISLTDPVGDELEPLPQQLFEPNQNGLIVLPGQTRGALDGVSNPFDIRLLTQRPIHEVKVRFGGVVLGDRPTALLNGKPFSRKDRWDVFNIVSVGRDSLLMERDGLFVLLPRGRDVAIRIPQ